MKNIIFLLSLVCGAAIAGGFGDSTVPPGTGATTFIKDGNPTLVSKDSVTPANSKPLPVELSGSGVVTVNQGTKGTVPQSWYVQPCDGTNCQSFLSTGEGKVSVTQPLPTGSNTIGNVGRTWSLASAGDAVSAWLKDGSGNSINSTSNALNTYITGGTITTTNPSVGATGSAPPSSATFIGAINDFNGNMVGLHTDPSGYLETRTMASVLPTGAATSSNQATEISSLSTIATNTTGLAQSTQLPSSLGAKTTANSTAVNIASDQTVPVSASSLPLPSNAAQESGGHLASIDTKLTSPISIQGGNSTAVKVDGSAVTQPISVSSLPLPTGAATSSNQTATQGSVFGGTAATSSDLVGGVYNSIAPTLTNGQQSSLQLDTSGNLKIAGSITASNPSVGVINSTAPSQATQIGGYNGGTLHVIKENGSGALVVDGSAVTQPVSIGSSVTVQQSTGTNLHTVIDSGTVTANAGTGNFTVVQGTGTNLHTVVDSGALTANAGTGTFTVGQATGSNLHTVIDSGTISLPSNAAQETGGNLATINTNTSHLPTALGSTTSSASLPVVIASDQGAVNTSMPDSYITGQSAQTATVNNIITATSGSAASDVSGYRSASIQVVSTGTAGTFIFEGSNDNVNFQSIPVYNQLILTGTPITAAVTASASQLIYTFPVTFRYVRLRIASTITGGSIQAFTRFSQAAWTPAIFQVAQGTTANLQTTSTIASGTVTTVSTVTASNAAIPGLVADVPSAAITTTTTTAAFTPTSGNSYVIDIPVTVVSGTTPTYLVQVQESSDTGTNWQTVYTFPTITTTGFYISPPLQFKGNRVRYVQTVGGTTPSFTRAINRLQMTMSATAAPVSNNATGSSTTVTNSSASTLTAPTNSVGFILQNQASSTANIRYLLGGTATATVGIELLPGQDSGFIPAGSNISIIAESGTQNYNVQWIQQ